MPSRKLSDSIRKKQRIHRLAPELSFDQKRAVQNSSLSEHQALMIVSKIRYPELHLQESYLRERRRSLSSSESDAQTHTSNNKNTPPTNEQPDTNTTPIQECKPRAMSDFPIRPCEKSNYRASRSDYDLKKNLLKSRLFAEWPRQLEEFFQFPKVSEDIACTFDNPLRVPWSLSTAQRHLRRKRKHSFAPLGARVIDCLRLSSYNMSLQGDRRKEWKYDSPLVLRMLHALDSGTMAGCLDSRDKFDEAQKKHIDIVHDFEKDAHSLLGDLMDELNGTKPDPVQLQVKIKEISKELRDRLTQATTMQEKLREGCAKHIESLGQQIQGRTKDVWNKFWRVDVGECLENGSGVLPIFVGIKTWPSDADADADDDDELAGFS